MTCKQCKNYDECQFDAACNNAVFDPDVSAEYCTGAEPITNADRIRAMSDEELANVVVCPHTGNWDLCKQSCFECRIKWLQKPAGEE